MRSERGPVRRNPLQVAFPPAIAADMSSPPLAPAPGEMRKLVPRGLASAPLEIHDSPRSESFAIVKDAAPAASVEPRSSPSPRTIADVPDLRSARSGPERHRARRKAAPADGQGGARCRAGAALRRASGGIRA